MFQDHFFSFGMLNLIFFNNIILVDRFHSEEFLSFFSLNKEDSSKGSSTKYNFRSKIFKSNLFFEVFFREESLCCSSHHLSFLFLSFEIFFIGLIIVHHVVSFDLFWSLFFLFFFCCGIMNKAQFIFVINWQFIVFQFPICL